MSSASWATSAGSQPATRSVTSVTRRARSASKAATPASVARTSQARPSSGSATRSTRPRSAMLASRRLMVDASAPSAAARSRALRASRRHRCPRTAWSPRATTSPARMWRPRCEKSRASSCWSSSVDCCMSQLYSCMPHAIKWPGCCLSGQGSGGIRATRQPQATGGSRALTKDDGYPTLVPLQSGPNRPDKVRRNRAPERVSGSRHFLWSPPPRNPCGSALSRESFRDRARSDSPLT